MKINSLIAASFLAVVPVVNAGVVSGTNIELAGSGDTIILVNGSAATSGIAVGGWFNAGFDLTTSLAEAIATNDFSSLISNFNVLASGQLGGPDALGEGYAGNYFFSDTYSLGADATLGAQLYTFIGDGSSLAASTYFGLISHTETVDADTPIPDDNNLLFSNGTVLVGEIGTTQYDFGTGELVTTPSLSLILIPEPSTALLGAVGALGLLRRRR